MEPPLFLPHYVLAPTSVPGLESLYLRVEGGKHDAVLLRQPRDVLLQPQDPGVGKVRIAKTSYYSTLLG